MKPGKKQVLESTRFAIRRISQVATERQRFDASLACEELLHALEGIPDPPPPGAVEQLARIRVTATWIASDLLAAAKFEMREILVPFAEVKEPTRKFGVQMFPDYFRWLSPNSEYTPELLVGILEAQEHELTIALEHLHTP